jgi:hypothetical protein
MRYIPAFKFEGETLPLVRSLFMLADANCSQMYALPKNKHMFDRSIALRLGQVVIDLSNLRRYTRLGDANLAQQSAILDENPADMDAMTQVELMVCYQRLLGKIMADHAIRPFANCTEHTMRMIYGAVILMIKLNCAKDDTEQRLIIQEIVDRIVSYVVFDQMQGITGFEGLRFDPLQTIRFGPYVLDAAIMIVITG